MELWGPFSTESVADDFDAAVSFIGKGWLEKERKSGDGSDESVGEKTDSEIIRYYSSAYRAIQEDLGIEHEQVDKNAAIRFLEFGNYIRILSGTDVINTEGVAVDKTLSELYRRNLRTTEWPDDYIHELRTAALYVQDGHEIAFIDEDSSPGKCPEFRLTDTSPLVDIECKRPKPEDMNSEGELDDVGKIADVLDGITGKFHDSRAGVVHIDISPEIRLSKNQRFELRHEIKGEIANRSQEKDTPNIEAIILQQTGLKEEDGSPRSVVGVRGPQGDTTIIEISLSLIPHYFELPEDFTLLGMDANIASNAHQTMDDADEDLSTDPKGLLKMLDKRTWTLECMVNPDVFFDSIPHPETSISGNRTLQFGGTAGSGGYIEFVNSREIYQLYLPEELESLDRAHMFLTYGNDGMTASFMPVYEGHDIRVRVTEEEPTIRLN